MDKLLEHLAKEWAAISAAPFTFVLLGVLMFGVAYLAARWRYSSVIDQLRQASETLKERLLLKAEQAESYKERALKYDEKLLTVVDSTGTQLADRTLEFVSGLREFIERHQRQDQSVHENEWAEMVEAKDEENKKRLWHKFTGAMSRQSNERNAEYDRRFRVSALMLRDELRSRLPSYKPKEQHVDHMYEHPTNYFGFNDVAEDLERMARTIKAANNRLQPTPASGRG